MDCQTFDDALLDALYGELGEPDSSAVHEHAAGCEGCKGKLARLEQARAKLKPALEEPLPGGFEQRLLAAVDAAMPPHAAPAVDRSEGKVIPLFARPQLAIAATFLLVAGASVVFLGTSSRSEAPSAKADAPAAPAQATAAGGGGSGTDPGAPPGVVAPPAPLAAAAPTAAASALAWNGPEPPPPPEEARARRPVAPPARPATNAGSKGKSDDASPSTLARADASYAAGDYQSALALYQSAAASHQGTAEGSRASLGVARCQERLGNKTAARAKLEALKADAYVSTEAKQELDRLDTVRAAPPNAKPVNADHGDIRPTK